MCVYENERVSEEGRSNVGTRARTERLQGGRVADLDAPLAEIATRKKERKPFIIHQSVHITKHCFHITQLQLMCLYLFILFYFYIF